MMKQIFTVFLVIIITVTMAGCGKPESKYTLKQYNQLTTGMSHSECIRILGDQGVQASESIIQGIPGVMPTLKTEAYQWKNKDGSNLIVMFQNDRLTSKAQAGLK